MLVAGVLAGGPAAAGLPGQPTAETPAAQTVEGSIVAPLRFPQDATYTSWPGGQRQLWSIAGSNGHVGYTLALLCEEGGDCVEGGRFALDVISGATGLEDLDVTFYASFNPVVSTGTFAQRAVGGEAFTIPDGSRFAIVTMFDGLNATFRFRAWEPEDAAQRSRGLAPAPLPAAPGIHAGFGFEGDRVGAWKKRLRSRSHVVIGLIDTGVNPYHVAYRRPEYTIHPSLYIEGFPADAPALGINFDGSDYVAARNGDDGPVWSQVAGRTLYWIPGTNIIGAYSIRNEAGTPPAGVTQRPIIDDNGHGTGTSSVAGGAAFSFATRAALGSNPEALLVIIEGLGHDAMEWALNQPWIDVVSGSYGNPLAIPYNDLIDGFAQEVPVVQEELGQYEYRFTAPFVLRDGRTACFSAGNGLSRTGIAYDRYSSIRPTSGPSWVVTVGAISPRNEQDYGWHSVPVDLSSYGNHWPAAAPFSLDGEREFGGTSNATPVAAGVFSRALLAVRRTLGDAVEGIHVHATAAGSENVPALGPGNIAGGLAADGVLTRLELQDAVFKTARPGEIDPESYLFDPLVVPDSPLYFTMQGYGLANVASAVRATEVLLGRAPMPERPEVDAWIAAIDLIRDSVWPPPSFESGSFLAHRPRSEREPGGSAAFALEQNGPNPFTEATTIRFLIPAAARVRLEVSDVAGRRVAVLADGDYPAGAHAVAWDRRDATGAVVRPGIYFYQLAAGPWGDRKKMVVLP
ncbi:MAG: S8 family serine peptidase [Candidatus Eiseniibacteriota bacterium]